MYSLLSVVLLPSFFFFKQKTAYDMRISDWSSDVCSSDLLQAQHLGKTGVMFDAMHDPGARIAQRVGDSPAARARLKDRLAANIARRVVHARDQPGRCREIAGHLREVQRAQPLPPFLRPPARRHDGGPEPAEQKTSAG